MRLYTLGGTEYNLAIDFEKIKSYNEFNNYVLKYLTENDENIDDKKTIIKYMYEGEIINSNNFTDYINIDDIAITIIFQERKKEIYSNNYAFATIDENGNVITWRDPECGDDSTDYAFATIDENDNVITWGVLNI